jgi:hypothetical protein
MFVLSSLESAVSFFEFGAIASQRSKSSTSGCETQETSGNYETNHKSKTTTEKIKKVDLKNTLQSCHQRGTTR